MTPQFLVTCKRDNPCGDSRFFFIVIAETTLHCIINTLIIYKYEKENTKS
jgi:hypothetical protein